MTQGPALERRRAAEDDSAAKHATIHVGVLLSHSPHADRKGMRDFAHRMTEDARAELESATSATWAFHIEPAAHLETDGVRHPQDFIDEATLRMAEGSYDVVIVVTDVPLVSRRREVVPGLASAVCRVAVVSTRRLTKSSRGATAFTLESAAVRWNAATLLLHLLGHLFDLEHASDGTMQPFAFDEKRKEAPHFGADDERRLKRYADRFPEREQRGGGALRRLVFHLASAARHPADVLRPVWRSRAPLLPLSLPRLATAAIAPTLILVFSAEFWDVALHLSEIVAWTTAAGSIGIATVYLTIVLNLYFPHRERHVITEHAAVVNVAVFLIVLLMIIGLFAMICLLMLGIELFVFPPDLMRQWPSFENPQITIADTTRLAVFISTIGVITGALAGGLESRDVVRQFALFRKEP